MNYSFDFACHFALPCRLVGSLEYPLSQLWDQNIKEECLSLMPSHRAAGIKGAKKVH